MKNNPKTYKIPVIYSVWGLVEVEAESLAEAIQTAEGGDLPDKPEYIEDSFEVDIEGIEIHNELSEEDKGLCDSLTMV